MIAVDSITNSFFQSVTYLIHCPGSADCWIIDCGDWQPIVEYLSQRDLKLRGAILTHGHFDHIYGLNDLRQALGDFPIYCSDHARDELFDSKLNYSRYHDCEFVLNTDNVNTLADGDTINLSDDLKAQVIATPGHDKGCLSYIIADHIFTGDSLIPGVKTVTHLRGDKSAATQSENLLNNIIRQLRLKICPGHGEISELTHNQ